MKVQQAYRKFCLVLFLIVAIAVTTLCAKVTRNNTSDLAWGRSVPPLSKVVATFGLVSGGLSLLTLPLFIVCNVRVKLEVIWMTLLSALWLAEAIMASVYRTLKNDQRIYYCGTGNGTERFCRWVTAIQGLSFILFITALLYVFAICFYALGSRQWGNDSVKGASMPAWHSLFFEPPHPSGQVIVVQVPATIEGHAHNVRNSSPPMFTDCQCGCHSAHLTHPEPQSASDDRDSKTSPV